MSFFVFILGLFSLFDFYVAWKDKKTACATCTSEYTSKSMALNHFMIWNEDSLIQKLNAHMQILNSFQLLGDVCSVCVVCMYARMTERVLMSKCVCLMYDFH